MSRSVTARSVYDALRGRLKLYWVSGGGGEELAITEEDLSLRPATVGYLNLIHPNKVQVLGEEEIRYLASLEETSRNTTIGEIFDKAPVAVIVADAIEAPQSMRSAAHGSPTALICSAMRSHELINTLQHHVSRSLALKTTLHGVYMELFTMGVLITGSAGSGKSELALELLSRGHRLVADDAPEFTKVSPELIDGRSPEVLQDCIEVRGLGVLNVRQMFGDAAVKLNKFLRLIIHLETLADGEGERVYDRLEAVSSVQEVLGIPVPVITIPVMTGRNLAVMAEAAVRNFMLKSKGYDAASEFIARHSRLMQRQNGRGEG